MCSSIYVTDPTAAEEAKRLMVRGRVRIMILGANGVAVGL
jgi:hypothetical protein